MAEPSIETTETVESRPEIVGEVVARIETISPVAVETAENMDVAETAATGPVAKMIEIDTTVIGAAVEASEAFIEAEMTPVETVSKIEVVVPTEIVGKVEATSVEPVVDPVVSLFVFVLKYISRRSSKSLFRIKRP